MIKASIESEKKYRIMSSEKHVTIKDLITNDYNLSSQAVAIWKLSIPAILAQIASIAMDYIDAAMVGAQGANASAAIGLVASSTWLFGGTIRSVAYGISVQVAQCFGAKEYDKARKLLKAALPVVLLFSLLLGMGGMLISGSLPAWLHSPEAIRADASVYFRIFASSMPLVMLTTLGNSVLQCSGNIRLPSLLSSMLCVLDVIYNFLFIYPTRTVRVLGLSFVCPGAGLGVAGAAIGTALSQGTIALVVMVILLKRHTVLHFQMADPWKLEEGRLAKALRIASPMALERIAMCGAMVTVTGIISPLGAVAISANSFAVTAESLCYMPGYGVGSTATALVGQSIGAAKPKLAKRYSLLCTALAIVIMTCTGFLMWFLCPAVFGFLTPVEEIRELGIRILRVELFAEPLFAASIVASASLAGAGDTLIPGLMNLGSIWGVRVILTLLLVPKYGLMGAWIAMATELVFRGTIFLVRLFRMKWERYS
jgi:putative MATE family efflux protein